MNCRISSDVLARCVAESAASHNEICGILLGGQDYISAAVPIPNVAVDPIRSFELEPAAHLRVAGEARRAGLRLVGHYHSHPSGDSRPSRADAARAGEEGLYWLIVTPQSQALWLSRAQGSVEGAFDPVTLIRERTALQRRFAHANRNAGTIETGQPSA